MKWNVQICSTSSSYERVLKAFETEQEANEYLTKMNEKLKLNNWKACFYKITKEQL